MVSGGSPPSCPGTTHFSITLMFRSAARTHVASGGFVIKYRSAFHSKNSIIKLGKILTLDGKKEGTVPTRARNRGAWRCGECGGHQTPGTKQFHTACIKGKVLCSDCHKPHVSCSRGKCVVGSQMVCNGNDSAHGD